VSRVLQRADIEALLPHKGSACWLDSAEVQAERIVCRAAVTDAHPLREPGGVPAVYAIEYGAQAAALHRLATAPAGTVTGGRLLQARDLAFDVDWLDCVPQPLQIVADCAAASSELARYGFRITAAQQPERAVASGMLTLMLT